MGWLLTSTITTPVFLRSYFFFAKKRRDIMSDEKERRRKNKRKQDTHKKKIKTVPGSCSLPSPRLFSGYKKKRLEKRAETKDREFILFYY
jgi:hypothetical protein